MAADLGFEHVFRAPAPAPAPTLLLLHGTGGNEHDLVPLADALAPGAGVLSPRGKVLERGMPRFFRRLSEGVFDLDDLRIRTRELAAFVAAAASHYGLDPTAIVAVGFSNGANIAASTLLLEPGTLAGAILFRAMVPIVPDPLPSLGGTPVFMSNGRTDSMIPAAEAGGSGGGAPDAARSPGDYLDSTTTTPHGPRPSGIFFVTCFVSRSTTERSLDGPLAV
jgi:predicted esterase